MSGYTRLVHKTFEFDGDTVSVSYRRLKRTEFTALTPYFKQNLNGGVDMEFQSQEKFLTVMNETVSDCIYSMSGLKSSDFILDYRKPSDNSPGNGIEEYEEIITQMYFLPLLQMIAVAVIQDSLPPKKPGEEKK